MRRILISAITAFFISSAPIMDVFSKGPPEKAGLCSAAQSIDRGPKAPIGSASLLRIQTGSDLDLYFSGQFLAFRLRPEEHGDDDQQQEAYGAVHHR